MPSFQHDALCLCACASKLAQGGELFDRIVMRHRYSEKDAAAAFRTMVDVILHCHNM